MHENILLTLAFIVVAGVAAQWVAWRTQIPAIVFLLILGIVAGPGLGFLDPDRLFGPVLFPLVSLAVAVILFEGSLTLRFSELRGMSQVVLRLVSLGALLTWAVAAAAAHVFVGLAWDLAALFGALVMVTGPTVIVPLLRFVRPSAKVATVLRWEGIVIDPIGALAAVLVYQFLVSRALPDLPAWLALWVFVKAVAVGFVVGWSAAELLGRMLRHYLVPDYLDNVIVLAFVVGVFTAANMLAHEAGLLAVTVMGMRLANMKGVPLENILSFKETLTILLISVLFIVLAARLDVERLAEVGKGVVLVFLAIQFVAQPLKVWASTTGSGLRWQEKAMIAWIGPRGIVAAAVSALFALRLRELGHPGAEILVPLTFAVIIGTVLFAGGTARLAAQRLGVAEPQARGVLIVGAHRLGRELGLALTKLGFRTIVADTDYALARTARMAGLETFFGNVVSTEADRRLDLVGVGYLLAMSPYPELNALAAVRYQREFGRGNVYVLLTPEEVSKKRQQVLDRRYARLLGGPQVGLAELLVLFDRGGKVYTTRLSEAFTFEAYQERFAARGQLLLAIDPKGNLRGVGPEFTSRPGAEWYLLGVYLPEEGEKGDAAGPGPIEHDAGARS
ncbi:MAG: sodium:proton antiporter [Tepidiphilus sp.]|nr:sodium:proton antiporter [Tepidiphilus sp.]MDD3432578.1 sodium:proton antiporter [Tepidiphilus sp.]